MQEFAIQNYTRKCARESTVLGTLTLASGSTPCLFGGHGRATLSAKGTQPDYARIMVTRLSEATLLFCSALVREKTQTWKAEPSECPPTNVRKRMPELYYKRDHILKGSHLEAQLGW